MSRPGVRTIGDAMQELIRTLGIDGKLRQYEVVERWPELVGEQISRVATADRFDGSTLYVRVKYAPWRNELVFLKNDLIGKINGVMGEEIVHDIVFK